MKYRYCLLLLILFSFTAGCNLFSSVGDEQEGPIDPSERRKLPRELSSNEMQIVDGSGQFGLDLMKKLVDNQPDQNHFISPLSILMAYGMTMNGAEGETYIQMKQTFGLGEMSRQEINEAARKLMDLLVQFDDQVEFRIANSIWYRNTFSVEEDFLATNEEYYNAEVEAADFGDPATVDRINEWVDEHTEGFINKIVEGPIDPLMVMYLINAIYFNGDWSVQFDPEKTQTKPFSLTNESEAEAEMMQMDEQEKMLYKEGDDYRAVNLYYGDAGFAMTLVLPDEGAG